MPSSMTRTRIRAELTELELALDLNQIDFDEYEARESMLLRRLKDVRETRSD